MHFSLPLLNHSALALASVPFGFVLVRVLVCVPYSIGELQVPCFCSLFLCSWFSFDGIYM